MKVSGLMSALGPSPAPLIIDSLNPQPSPLRALGWLSYSFQDLDHDLLIGKKKMEQRQGTKKGQVHNSLRW